MLSRLSVRNIVLIERADTEFSPGLNVITGETGAGKSTLRSALHLALGGRADTGLIRKGSDRAEVIACFSENACDKVAEYLAEKEIFIEAHEELTLRRILFRNKPARAYVNDTPVTAGVLAGIGERITEICGQFDDSELRSPRGFREILDHLLPDKKIRLDVKEAYASFKQAVLILEAERNAIESALKERDYAAHVFEELNALAPETGEEVTLAEKRAKMHALEKNAVLIQSALKKTEGDYHSGGIENLLIEQIKNLSAIEKDFPEEIARITEALSLSLEALGNATAELSKLNAATDFDSGELERAEERLFALRAAARKFRVNADELPRLRAEFSEKVDRADRGEARLIEAEKNLQSARSVYFEAAEKLSQARRAISGGAASAVTEQLSALKMENARFEIAFEPEEEPTSYGSDRVIFKIAVNPGAELTPLHISASGGELSRVTLAVKCALAGSDPGRTLIFDEIDRGVGGATASAVGAKLKETADRTGQALAITHSPQVAAKGDTHFHIVKHTDADEALSVITQLTGEKRTEEIARMLSGETVTESARAAAETLLSGAV